MIKLICVFIMGAVVFLSSGVTNAYAVDCDKPCGALELIECAATAAGKSAKEYYNTILFDSKSVLDGFCEKPYSGSNDRQKYYYDNFCSENAGEYYSYSNFKAALETGHFDKFCCADDTIKEQRYKELANFLATIASETTSTIYGYKNDGLYYRYEAGSLAGAGKTMQDPTQYTPADNWRVAVSSSNKKLINTQIYWSYDDRYPDQTMTYHPGDAPMTITFGALEPPDGFEAIQMNEVIEPGYWCGMGATQLTGDTMVGFFGWYYNNVEHEEAANYKEFVNTYVVDGKMGFMGAFWYWMYRVSGSGYRTPHQAVTNVDKPVCQDIACATMMVNGGCNDYPTNRLKYYQYFIPELLGQDYKIVEVEQEFEGETLENLKCPYDEGASSEQQYIDAFLNYCRPK